MPDAAKPRRPSKRLPFLAGLGAILALVLIAQTQLGAMPVTGDEPEYIYRALSVWLNGNFHLPMNHFAAALPDLAPLVARGFTPISGHPVLMSILAAPLTGLFGITGARAVSVLCALIALTTLASLLRTRFTTTITLLTTALIAFTFPVVAYTHLFYTEMMLMALITTSLALAQRSPGPNLTFTSLCASLCAVLLPFIHIRAAPLAAALACIIFLPLLKPQRRHTLIPVTAIFLAGGALFLWHQFTLFGHLVAGASATFHPSLIHAPGRLVIQLTDFRHGLLSINPACIPAIAGLLIGLRNRSRLARQACLLLLAYVPPMIWGTASESYPARFWTPVMPVLGIGFAFWLARTRTLPARIAGAILALIALLNTKDLLHNNFAFLGNQMAGLTWDESFPFHDRFNIAGFLPWDSFNYTDAGMNPALALDHSVMLHATLFCTTLIAAFIIAALSETRRWTGWLPLAALAPLFVISAMRPLAAENLAVTSTSHHTILTLRCPAPVRLVRILSPQRPKMIPPDFPSALTITTRSTTNTLSSWHAPFAPVIAIPHGTYTAITLTPTGNTQGPWKSVQFAVMTAGYRMTRCPKQYPSSHS